MLATMTVVDVSQQLPGPYTSALLAQLGARVVKVEPPAGDPSRRIDPAMFELVNAGKDVLRLDLKSAEGVGRLHELVTGADVFIEGFRPGVAARLAADWTILHDLNPRLVYCSISGSGQDGPLGQTPVHDLNLQSFAGIDPGPGIGVPWVDLGTATSAALAIVAAWHEAGRDGYGAYLDAAMLDTAVLWARVKASAHGRVEPTYGIFATADGHRVAVAILEDHMWPRLCAALGWDDWAADAAYAGYLARVERATAIHGRLVEACASRSLSELLARADEYDLPLTPAGVGATSAVGEQFTMRGLDDTGGRRLPLPMVRTML